MTGYTSTNTQILSGKFFLYLRLWDFTHSLFQFTLWNLILKSKIKLRTLKSPNLRPFFIFAYWNKTPQNTVSQKSRDLTDFLKTNFAAIWVKETKVKFFAPDDHATLLWGTLRDDKNGYVADYLGDGGVFGQKISCLTLTEEVYLAVTFSKIRLEI